MIKEFSIAALSLATVAASGAMAQSYLAPAVTFGDNVVEEGVIGRYQVPQAPLSVRGHYISFENPEAALSLTYDTPYGVYLGGGVVTSFGDGGSVLTTSEDDAGAFAQVGYEYHVERVTLGADYKTDFDEYAITAFAGLSF